MFESAGSQASRALLPFLIRGADALLVMLAGFVALALRFEGGWPEISPYLALCAVAALSAYAFFPAFGLYRSWRGHSLVDLFGRLFLAWSLVLLGLAVALVLVKEAETFSRLWLGIWWGAGLLLLMGFRLGLYQLLAFLRRRGWNHRRVLIVGTGAAAANLVARARRETWTGFEVVGVLSTSGEGTEAEAALPLLGTLDALEPLMAQHQVDEVWLAVPLRDESIVRAVLARLSERVVTIRFAPDIFGLRLLNHSVSEVLGYPMLDLSASPMTGLNRLVKGIEDRLLAALILLLVSPLMLLIALAVKLSSPGPVFFRQQRLGWDGRPFRIYKFRSMVVHEEPAGQVVQASRQDARLTRVGAFLRRTSLDELPQFINVLQGKMSIVGPRPHALAHNDQYKGMIEGYMLRHKVKPGITGWAQVNGWRGETDTLEKMQKRIEYDLYYIEHWSLAFDLKIIFLTLFRGFVHKNAY